MADILDQEAIDKLKNRLDSLTDLRGSANSAKDKISLMYYDIVGLPLQNALDTLSEIGDAVNDINNVIKIDSKYYTSFLMLKTSYLRRVQK